VVSGAQELSITCLLLLKITNTYWVLQKLKVLMLILLIQMLNKLVEIMIKVLAVTLVKEWSNWLVKLV